MLNAAMRTNWGRLAVAVLGALIYALGINLFVAPLGLITGGSWACASCCGPSS